MYILSLTTTNNIQYIDIKKKKKKSGVAITNYDFFFLFVCNFYNYYFLNKFPKIKCNFFFLLLSYF